MNVPLAAGNTQFLVKAGFVVLGCPLFVFFGSLLAAWLSMVIALRPYRKHAGSEWVERARLAYGARKAVTVTLILLPIIAVVILVAGGDGEESPIPSGAISLCALAAFAGGLLIVYRLQSIILPGRAQLKAWCRGLAGGLLALAPHFAIVAVAFTIMPDRLNGEAVVILIVAGSLIVAAMTGVALRLAMALGLARQPSPRLAAIVAAAGARTGTQPQGVYELDATYANAVAFPLGNRLLITDAALATLSDEELTAISVHELAHLNEPRGAVVARTAGGVAVWLALLALRPLGGSFGPSGLLAIVIILLVAVMILRRLGRRMEVRADTQGHAHQGEAGTYAWALEKLYQANLLPVVMPGKHAVHPHLYDRMVAAGVQPAYPRPKPPVRWAGALGTIVALFTGVVLFVVVRTIAGIIGGIY